MKLYVTRHGQTDWNVQGKTQGRTDIELNEVGIEQAKQTKKELKNINIDLIKCIAVFSVISVHYFTYVHH